MRVTRHRGRPGAVPSPRAIAPARFFPSPRHREREARRATESRSASQRGGTSARATRGRSGAIFETHSAVLGDESVARRHRPAESSRLATDSKKSPGIPGYPRALVVEFARLPLGGRVLSFSLRPGRPRRPRREMARQRRRG